MSDLSSSLSGRRFLVTGSTRGIGRAIAEHLLEQGAVVGIHGRDKAVAERVTLELGRARVLPLATDLADPAAAQGLVEAFVEGAGGIDGLVNNAGSGGAVAFRGLSLDRWRETFRVNIEAAFVASQAAYVEMRKRKRGAIVNVASLSAHGPGKWLGADYAASKAALVSLTQSLALEAARFGVRCNAVSPGFVDTEMTERIPEEMRDRLGIPLGRMAAPEEVASVVSFLLRDESAYMTGQVLHVDGGLWMNG